MSKQLVLAPNLFRLTSNSPAALEGYLGLLAPRMEWGVVASWPYKPPGRGPQGVADGVLSR